MVQTIDDGGGYVSPAVFSPAVATQLTVSIDAIEDFIRQIEGHVTNGLEPYAEQIISAHWSGDAIARNAVGQTLYDFRFTYNTAVDSAVAGLRSYVEQTKVLLRALQLLADHYRNADAMVVASLEDVNIAMSMAQTQATAETAPPVNVTPI